MLWISADGVNRLLRWPDLVRVLENAFVQLHNKDAGIVIPQRSFTEIPDKSATFLCMPAYSSYLNIITCKLLTIFNENWQKHKLSSHQGCITVFNGDNGSLMGYVDAVSVTTWRTAAGSIVGAKHLLSSDTAFYKNKTLAVLGAGDQGKAHITGFQKVFNFGKVNLWNRGHQRALDLSKQLQEENISVQPFEDAKECVKDADVIICTFAFTPDRFITRTDIPKCSLLIFVGYPVNGDAFGIDGTVYRCAKLYTEQLSNVQHELRTLIQKEQLEFEEIGRIIQVGTKVDMGSKELVLYQTLGIAVMDTAAVKLILDKHAESEG